MVQQGAQRLDQACQHSVMPSRRADMHMRVPLEAGNELHHTLERQDDEQQHQDGGARSMEQR
jgi:hypothetical protein